MKEQLERQIDILRHAKIISVNHGNFECGASFKELEFKLREELKALDTKEQREFKNKDFHVKVWQDSEKIGIETVWIREGFWYESHKEGLEGLKMGLKYGKTRMDKDVYFFTTRYNFTDSTYEELVNYSYSDIVTELEKAHKLSSEVSIYDVIKECEGVTDWDKVYAILSKYVFINGYGKTIELNINTDCLTDPYDFIRQGYQLRLKEGE